MESAIASGTKVEGAEVEISQRDAMATQNLEQPLASHGWERGSYIKSYEAWPLFISTDIEAMGASTGVHGGGG
eukprot:9466194-Pyramimonas_sp.AAC.1